MRTGFVSEMTAYVIDPSLALGRVVGCILAINRWNFLTGPLHWDDPLCTRNTQYRLEINDMFRQIRREVLDCNEYICFCSTR